MSFLMIIIMVAFVVLAIALLFALGAFALKFAVPILIIALIIWLYKRFRYDPEHQNDRYYEETTYETFQSPENSPRKKARDAKTDDVDEDK